MKINYLKGVWGTKLKIFQQLIRTLIFYFLENFFCFIFRRSKLHKNLSASKKSLISVLKIFQNYFFPIEYNFTKLEIISCLPKSKLEKTLNLFTEFIRSDSKGLCQRLSDVESSSPNQVFHISLLVMKSHSTRINNKWYQCYVLI